MRTASVLSEHSLQEYTSAGGARIFQLPLQEFPGLWGWAYLVLAADETGDYRVLIDTGSGFGEANSHLEGGLQAVSERLGRPLGFADLTHVLITHAHIDHFGGLSFVRERTQAKVGVHELDRRVLTSYEERLTVVGRRLREFLVEAGLSSEQRQHLLQMYGLTKSMYRSVKVDFTYEAEGMRVGPFRILHVPGHSAGHVVLRLHDVLFSGDHVLEHTSPHQSPEHLTLSTGLDHYLHSLDALEAWAGDVRLTLGGHEQPVLNLSGRIQAIRDLHRERLDRVLALLEQPGTVQDVSHGLFGQVQGYNALLAIEEAGAHVEYLYQRGILGIENLGELEGSAVPGPIRYVRIRETEGHL